MRAKEYILMEEAVEQGVMWGWQHAHKHVEHPEPEAIKEQIVNDVLNEICARFDFEDTE